MVSTPGMASEEMSPRALEASFSGRGEASGQRRTFKEKLLEKIQSASVVRNEEQGLAQDRKRLAVKMLSEGHVKGFVDFIYLSHRRDLDRTRPSDEELLARRIDPERYEGVPPFPLEHVPTLYTHLTAADNATTMNDVPASFHAYEALGDYFDRSDAYDEALHFFNKCLAIAKEARWRQAELSAEAKVGNVLQRMGLGQESLVHHEHQLELSRETGAASALRSAQDHLLDAYQQQASDLQAAGKLDAALACLDKLLTLTRDADRPFEEAKALSRLAQIHQALGDDDKAVEFYEANLEMSRSLHDNQSIAASHLALSKCMERRGDTPSAMRHLDQYLKMSNPSSDLRGYAEACCRLGKIHFDHRSYEMAVKFFETFYKLAQDCRDTRLMELARLNLGTARGRLMELKYMELVCSGDLDALLKWKLEREPFT